MDQGVTGKGTLQVGFTGIFLRKQAAIRRLFRPDLSTYPSRYPRSRGYVRKQTEPTQEHCVSESISDMLNMVIPGIRASRDEVSGLPASCRGVMETRLEE